MKKLHFAYDMQIEYSTTVSNCNFTIKCIPADTRRQRVDSFEILLNPDTDYQWGKDGFHNTQIWGNNLQPHTFFQFQIQGNATTGLADYEVDVDTNLAMVFAYSHGLNTPGENIRNFYHTKLRNIDIDTYDKALEITRILFASYQYQFGVTTVETSAEEAFCLGCGVCQDYAHILISLFHLAGITARYVTGFIIGEGASHAWVEFLVDGKWYGIDPTHNRLVNDDYIKIGHGRDAKDCMINRGIMHGGGLHMQKVNVSVLEK